MRRSLFVIVPLLLMLMLCERLRAQSIDPTLAAMILLYTEKAENSLRTEQEAMLLETFGHIWVKSEVEGDSPSNKQILFPLLPFAYCLLPNSFCLKN